LLKPTSLGIAGAAVGPLPKTWLEEPMLAKMRREPALEDLLNDPIVRLVMKADDVTEADLRVLVATLRARLNRSDERQAA
jgi:hypothetical protein